MGKSSKRKSKSKKQKSRKPDQAELPTYEESTSFPDLSAEVQSETNGISNQGDAIAQQDEPLHSCAVCETPTNGYCTSCGYEPILITLDSQATFYCSQKCIDQDFDQHKSRCEAINNLYHLTVLGRVSDLLQRLFYIYREVSFDLPIDSIDYEPGSLIVTQGTSDDESVIRFPEDRVQELDMPREQLLTLASGKDVVSQFFSVCTIIFNSCKARAYELLKWVEEVEYTPHPDPSTWILYTPNNTTPVSSRDITRYVYKITLQNETEWAIDLNAAQFGYPPTRTLRAWQQYERDRIAQINVKQEWGNICGDQVDRFRPQIGDTVGEAKVCGQYWAQNNVAMSLRNCMLAVLRDRSVWLQDMFCVMGKEDYQVHLDALLSIMRQEFGLTEKDWNLG